MSREKNGNVSVNDLQNPLFLHPNEHSGSLSITDKLVGAKNYRSWRRQVQIGLTTKRKLGFITGTLKRSETDDNLAEQWDIKTL